MEQELAFNLQEDRIFYQTQVEAPRLRNGHHIGTERGLGALAGVIVYLYFRYESLREYERGEERYESSKRALLQSL